MTSFVLMYANGGHQYTNCTNITTKQDPALCKYTTPGLVNSQSQVCHNAQTFGAMFGQIVNTIRNKFVTFSSYLFNICHL